MNIARMLPTTSNEHLTQINSNYYKEMNNTISKSELRKRDPIGQLLDSLCNSSSIKEENIGSAFKPIIKSTTPPTFMPKCNQICSTYRQIYPHLYGDLFQDCTHPNQIFPISRKLNNPVNNYVPDFVPDIPNFHRGLSHLHYFPKHVHQHYNGKMNMHTPETRNDQIYSELRNFSFFPWMKTSPLHSNLSKPKIFARVEKQPSTAHHPPRYQCESCKKSYSTFGGLSKHKQFHCVNQVKKEFTCKFCGKSYGSLGALKMHIRTHTLPCKCKLCGKAFSRPWLLQGHVRTHTGEKPFRCDHCGRAFADRSNLRAHLQTHSDIKKYGCKNCSKTFSRMSLLVKHKDNNNCIGQQR